ncbi:MAG: hypothetical protein ACFFG0_03900 [Candidatus Thorarchaeota archaeon]
MKIPCETCITFAICKQQVNCNNGGWKRIYHKCEIFRKFYKHLLNLPKKEYIERVNKIDFLYGLKRRSK